MDYSHKLLAEIQQREVNSYIADDIGQDYEL